MSSTATSQPPAAATSDQSRSNSTAVERALYDQNGFPQSKTACEPFPNIASPPSFQYHASLHHLDTTPPQAHQTKASPHTPTPLSAGLRLRTEHLNEKAGEEPRPLARISSGDNPEQTVFNAGLPVRSSSVRSALSSRTHRSDSLTPASALSSPGVGPLVEMTPLPSPMSSWGSPGFGRSSVDEGLNESSDTNELTPEPLYYARSSPKKRMIPDSPERARIYEANAAAHARNRSISEYVPEGMQVPRSRNIVVSTSGAPLVIQQPFSPPEDHMHREQYLAIQRGLAISIPRPPTPPDSNTGRESVDLESLPSGLSPSKGLGFSVYEARTVRGAKLKKWRALRQLGKGTFSNVILATSEDTDGSHGLLRTEDEVPPNSLVAIKICEQGPAGGADEKKIEVSIKRELEIMKSIDHPSLVHLKAVNVCERQAFLVLNYCAGGDLFELANMNLDILTPSLIRRMFTELVGAVRYLHSQYIVHRDIKLENVLVNLPTAAFHTIGDWQSYPYPILTLTDLGLGRWIPRPPESPLLDTRCGSEDYAAPEVLMGQEYDGRATDAWALGVLLYALMEGRLPFDPVPGARRKSPTSHRIARCEWQWVRWADADGEWDSSKGHKLDGAREIVEGLLARTRSRWSLEKVQKTEWVFRGIMVDGELKRAEDHED